MNIDALTRILPDQINMKFATAFAFFLSSIALLFIDWEIKGEREISQIVLPATTISLLLIMTALLVVRILGVHTGVEDLFVHSDSVKTVLPGMPAIPTMINFILFGVASILVLFESSRTKQQLSYLAIPIILIGLVACIGYLLQIPFLYYQISEASNAMAPNTAIMIVLLGLGLILSARSQKHENKL